MDFMDPDILVALAHKADQATGRDPWLNRDIEVAVGRGRDCDDSTRQKDAYAMPLNRHDYYVAPSYSTSLDAALSLMDLLSAPARVLLTPLIDNPHGHLWNVGLLRIEDGDPAMGWQGWGSSPAAALCGALLRALARQARVLAQAGVTRTGEDPLGASVSEAN